jgi:hypothetical protein
MSTEQSSRRKFLKFLGLTAGVTIAAPAAFASFIDPEEIKKLNPEQQEFMMRYGSWMDEMTEIARIDIADPDNKENKRRKMALAQKAEEFQPELDAHMQDKTFALIYNESIKRLTAEIQV